MALTDQEKERCRYHLGYLGVSYAGSISLGIPRPIQTLFLVETAMNNLVMYSEGRVRELLGRLDATEERIFSSQERLAASKLGEITLRDNEPDQLENEYQRWAMRLADVMGCPLYPYSKRFATVSGGGNVPVRG